MCPGIDVGQCRAITSILHREKEAMGFFSIKLYIQYNMVWL